MKISCDKVANLNAWLEKNTNWLVTSKLLLTSRLANWKVTVKPCSQTCPSLAQPLLHVFLFLIVFFLLTECIQQAIYVEIKFNRVWNCALLVANVTKNFALATRISQLVGSGRLATLFHATIITQTIALIFSQIDQNKIQSCPPISHFLFTTILHSAK